MNGAVWLALSAAPALCAMTRAVWLTHRARRARLRADADLALINALWAADVDQLTEADWEAWFRA